MGCLSESRNDTAESEKTTCQVFLNLLYYLTILLFSILFSLIALPALGELTDADLDKIRLVVKEEVKTEKATHTLTDITGPPKSSVSITQNRYCAIPSRCFCSSSIFC